MKSDPPALRGTILEGLSKVVHARALWEERCISITGFPSNLHAPVTGRMWAALRRTITHFLCQVCSEAAAPDIAMISGMF